jgi:hypothetical protein
LVIFANSFHECSAFIADYLLAVKGLDELTAESGDETYEPPPECDLLMIWVFASNAAARPAADIDGVKAASKAFYDAGRGDR